jgi:hypothetical protein
VFDFVGARTFAATFENVDRAYTMQPTGYVQAKVLVPVVEALAVRKIKVVLQSVFDFDAGNASLSTGGAGVGALGYCLRNSSSQPVHRRLPRHGKRDRLRSDRCASIRGEIELHSCAIARQVAWRQILVGGPSFVDVSLTPHLKPTAFETHVASLTLFATQFRSA